MGCRRYLGNLLRWGAGSSLIEGPAESFRPWSEMITCVRQIALMWFGRSLLEALLSDLL